MRFTKARKYYVHEAIALLCSAWLLTYNGIEVARADVLESRVIFDETFSWLTPEGADQMLARSKFAGFNVIVPVVWHGRGTSWPSQISPPEPLWDKKGRRADHDPLRYLIERAHQIGLEVHPWFTVSLRQREFLQQFYDEGTPEKAFNIHLPGFRRYMVDLMLEVVRNYDIDGINLDYIRSMGICVSKFCIKDYRRRMGRNLLSDMKRKEDSLGWTSIARWNAEAVEDLLYSFINEARLVKPNLFISVSSHAGLPALLYQGTDSIRWANLDWIDVIFHMEYAAPDKWRTQLISKAIAALNDPRKLVLMVGNYEKSALNKDLVWPRDADAVVDLVGRSQRLGFEGNGIALYEYPYLSDSQIDKLRQGPFLESAKPDWKTRTGTR